MNENDWTSRPICCPHCGSKAISAPLVTWRAYSEEDPSNTAELSEYQCEGECAGRSFWA